MGFQKRDHSVFSLVPQPLRYCVPAIKGERICIKIFKIVFKKYGYRIGAPQGMYRKVCYSEKLQPN
jgi:hypothetical protein